MSDLCLFFFKQKTAYEMRISDWSSDVCSSDLPRLPRFLAAIDQIGRARDTHHQQDRNAALREAEMVGAVEEAAFGKAFGRHTAPLRRREACQVILERPLSLADEDDVLCPPGGLEDVEAEVGDGLFKREDRFRGIGFGPEQAADRKSTRLNSSH